jgi:hypothetical protein
LNLSQAAKPEDKTRDTEKHAEQISADAEAEREDTV